MELLSTFPRKTSVFQFSRIDFAPWAKMSEKYKFSHIQYLERINRCGAMPKHLQFEISWIFSLVIEKFSMTTVPAGSPSRGGDVTVYVWHKPTELARSSLFCSCVYFCLFGPFNCISFHKFSWQLSAFQLCSSGLVSALLVLSTIYHFMKVSFSPDMIPSGWLGSKHQITN